MLATVAGTWAADSKPAARDNLLLLSQQVPQMPSFWHHCPNRQADKHQVLRGKVDLDCINLNSHKNPFRWKWLFPQRL